jgi:hypothetical protein
VILFYHYIRVSVYICSLVLNMALYMPVSDDWQDTFLTGTELTVSSLWGPVAGGPLIATMYTVTEMCT